MLPIYLYFTDPDCPKAPTRAPTPLPHLPPLPDAAAAARQTVDYAGDVGTGNLKRDEVARF